MKRMAAGIIIFDSAGRMLIVKPSYKDHWSVPGGVIDKNESPRVAALREVKEEIKLDLKEVSLLCVDYMSPAESGYITKDENIQFIFFGGTLSDDEISKIKIPKDEIEEYKFVEPAEALKLVNDRLANRIKPCLEAIKSGTPVYLEGGEIAD